MKLSKIKNNPNNPRLIKDDKYRKLVKSIEEFPKMMSLRPIIINDDFIVLGGNMRLKVLQELGYKEIPDEWVKKASELTSEEQRRFIIADNVGFGEHDWEMLANQWDAEQLADWGLDVWQAPADIDYSLLEEVNIDNEISEKENGIKKAIQIEFEQEHYEEAFTIIKFWRERDAYVGKMILDYLKEEKNKL